MFNHSLRKALWSAIVPALLTACQPADNFQRQPDDVVRYGSQASSARAAADVQKYIITFKADPLITRSLPDNAGTYDARVQQMQGLIARLVGTDIAGKTQEVYTTAIRGFAAELTTAELARLQRLPFIASIVPDQVVSLAVPTGIDITIGAQTVPWGIERVGGSRLYTGPNKAWILDTGIDFDHPDLNVDLPLCRNFNNPRRNADDDNGHGSHVAGTIGAKDNNFGVVGVAAGVKVIAVKVLAASGSGSYAGVIAGIDYVATAGAPGDVANMSLGGGIYAPVDEAVKGAANKGILFALAAGNESQNANNSSPGRTNHPNVYTVSAHDYDDKFASFSNFGNPPIDWCAPGVSVLSTWRSGGYRTISGTSMATPHVAGILLYGTPASRGPVIGDRDSNPDQMAKLPSVTP
ncbi:S8 family serine peptidase [Spirosoma fluviale]|uniref:Peptidase inhibitor I9 n=1 Tax=Spirosoma fluviale TaxID=1597977 RepID=A0A286G0H2_9BACT|nr:S8 family serine peptidase [Spirosoma fluviale]SOD88968.1 Peptidase inhibitor I9 [Spirosoma fluviale]